MFWKKYSKIIFIVLGFLLITAPGAVDSWLSLIQRFQGNQPEMTISLGNWHDIYSVVFPVLGLGVIIFALWWTRSPKKEAVSESLPFNGKSVIRNGNTPAIEVKGQATIQWLEGVLSSDLSAIKGVTGGHILYYITKIADYSNLKEDEPHFYLDITVLNAACFDILVEDAGGKLKIEKKPLCAEPIQLNKEARPIVIRHSEQRTIKIIQQIKTKEMAGYIRSTDDQQHYVWMNFSECYITIRPQIPGMEMNDSINLPLITNTVGYPERIEGKEP